jgi:hypothetical protein
MEAKSQLKVIEAGFTIIRKQDAPQIIIKYKDAKQHEWATHTKFVTKAARDRVFDKLLNLKHVISD